jgi:hypothetical protein
MAKKLKINSNNVNDYRPPTLDLMHRYGMELVYWHFKEMEANDAKFFETAITTEYNVKNGTEIEISGDESDAGAGASAEDGNEKTPKIPDAGT